MCRLNFQSGLLDTIRSLSKECLFTSSLTRKFRGFFVMDPHHQCCVENICLQFLSPVNDSVRLVRKGLVRSLRELTGWGSHKETHLEIISN